MTDAAAVPPLTLFLMSEKGFRVLQHIVAHLDKSMVALVVGARDEQMARIFSLKSKPCARGRASRFEAGMKAPPVTVYALAVSWRWLIAEPIQLIVMHDSLLPRYRGFAPLVSYLINGEPQIGVTALHASADFDCGPVLAQAARPVQYPMRVAAAIALVVECYAEVVGQLWPMFNTASLPPGTPQREADATYSLWRDEQDYRINWHRDSTYLRRFIDALGWPYQGASTLWKEQKFRVLAAETVPDVVIENRTPGKVLFVREGQPVVVCGTGLLRLTELRTDQGTDALPLVQFRARFE